MSCNFSQKVQIGVWEVQVDPDEGYGYFERETDGAGGGLWFDVDAALGKLSLVDYDGVCALHSDVVKAIRELGHVVGPEFE